MAIFSKNIDMLNGTIWDKMVVFAIPLALTGVLQQLYNLADVAVLGHFVSNEAVAAVGTNVPIVGLIVAFCIGLSIGANVVVARYLGMRKYDDASRAVHTAFATAVIFGVIAMAIGELCASILMRWMQVPPSVVRHSEIYLQMYLMGMPFISIYNFLSAVMRSQGDTQTPLWALCIASVFNALGDLFVVTVVDWGIGGVALMTALANLLASGILVYRLMRTDGPLVFTAKRLFKMDKKALRSMIKIGWPAGLQSSVFSLSNLIIQSAINSLGADVMAASVAAFTIEINCYCVINGFGLAATTFISQNYGAGNLERCKRITRVNMALNIGITDSVERSDLWLRPIFAWFLHTIRRDYFSRYDSTALGRDSGALELRYGSSLGFYARIRLLSCRRPLLQCSLFVRSELFGSIQSLHPSRPMKF